MKNKQTSEKEKLQQARILIQQKDYESARRLLKTLSHPKAKEWLELLEKRAPSQKGAVRKLLLWSLASCGIVFLGLIGLAVLMPSSSMGQNATETAAFAATVDAVANAATPTWTFTPSATPSPTNSPTPGPADILHQQLLAFDRTHSVEKTNVVEISDNRYRVSVALGVSPSSNTAITARMVRDIIIELLGESAEIDLAITLDDGTIVRDFYLFSGQQEWVVSEISNALTPSPDNQTTSSLQLRPIIAGDGPPLPSSYTYSSGASNSDPVPPSQPQTQTWDCSGDRYNCDSLSDEDLWSYFNTCPGDPSGLDRDGDGYPCELDW